MAWELKDEGSGSFRIIRNLNPASQQYTVFDFSMSGTTGLLTFNGQLEDGDSAILTEAWASGDLLRLLREAHPRETIEELDWN